MSTSLLGHSLSIVCCANTRDFYADICAKKEKKKKCILHFETSAMYYKTARKAYYG